MARVLVIEDDPSIHKIISHNLRLARHDVASAHSGREGLELARTRPPDLVVLDVMLPDISGGQVCTRLRADRATARIPIIMVTARGDEIDRVLGFELGADDYVVKPFSVRELMLRIEALIRRSQASGEPAQGVIEFGKLKIDRDGHIVSVNGRPIALTAIEYKLLCALYDRRSRVTTREVLVNEIWGSDAEITDRAIDTHVQRMREKLGATAGYIETVRGFGYRFSSSPR